MRALSAARVLAVTERCAATGNTGRALALLAAGWPDEGERELAELSLGERDRRLLALRLRTLGEPLPGRSRCSECGESFEFELTSADLRSLADAGPAKVSATVGELELELRQPNSFDLLAAERASSPAEAKRALAAACVLAACRAGRDVEPEELTDAELDEGGAFLAAAASALETRLRFECAECGHGWDEELDIAEFFSAELEVLADRLLDEVHVLARGYGWGENEILAMSARRRRRYLERLNR